jgi:hypothetical protein
MVVKHGGMKKEPMGKDQSRGQAGALVGAIAAAASANRDFVSQSAD